MMEEQRSELKALFLTIMRERFNFENVKELDGSEKKVSVAEAVLKDGTEEDSWMDWVNFGEAGEAQ